MILWCDTAPVQLNVNFILTYGVLTYLEQLHYITLQMKIGRVVVLLTETSK